MNSSGLILIQRKMLGFYLLCLKRSVLRNFYIYRNIFCPIKHNLYPTVRLMCCVQIFSKFILLNCCLLLMLGNQIIMIIWDNILLIIFSLPEHNFFKHLLLPCKPLGQFGPDLPGVFLGSSSSKIIYRI